MIPLKDIAVPLFKKIKNVMFAPRVYRHSVMFVFSEKFECSILLQLHPISM